MRRDPGGTRRKHARQEKVSTIIELMDRYTDEDSDVSLMTGVASPKQGPVFIPDETAVVADPEARHASRVSGPSTCSTDGKPPDQLHSSSTAATTTPAGEPRGASATTADEWALWEKKEQDAWDRRTRLQAAVIREKERRMNEDLRDFANDHCRTGHASAPCVRE